LVLKASKCFEPAVGDLRKRKGKIGVIFAPFSLKIFGQSNTQAHNLA